MYVSGKDETVTEMQLFKYSELFLMLQRIAQTLKDRNVVGWRDLQPHLSPAHQPLSLCLITHLQNGDINTHRLHRGGVGYKNKAHGVICLHEILSINSLKTSHKIFCSFLLAIHLD